MPGKKFRKELFHVDGAAISVEVRLTDSGQFFCAPDDNGRFQASTLVELRTQVKAYLEETRRLQFDPYIDVEYMAAKDNTRFTNYRGRQHREEVEIGFTAGWLSRQKITDDTQRWIPVSVDPDTHKIRQLTQHDRVDTFGGTYAGRALIPFTAARWQRLEAIAAALADVRGKIEEVLSDASGAKLEAPSWPKQLGGT